MKPPKLESQKIKRLQEILIEKNLAVRQGKKIQSKTLLELGLVGHVSQDASVYGLDTLWGFYERIRINADMQNAIADILCVDEDTLSRLIFKVKQLLGEEFIKLSEG